MVPPTRNRDANGRFMPQHSDDAVVDAVQVHSPAATSEVAGELDIARQSADERLRKLEATGRVDRKKIGKSLVWTLTATEHEGDNL